MALKVAEAYTRDVGKYIARIDEKTLKKLKIKLGDPVLIKGAHGKIVAKALGLYPDDEGKSIIRIDKLIRNNAKLQFGKKVNIEKIEVNLAKSVVFMFAQDEPQNPPLDARYLSDALEGIVVKKAMTVAVPYFGSWMEFKIVKTVPAGYVKIDEKTTSELKERPDTKVDDDPPEYIQSKIKNCDVFLKYLNNNKIKNPDLIQALAIIWSRDN